MEHCSINRKDVWCWYWKEQHFSCFDLPKIFQISTTFKMKQPPNVTTLILKQKDNLFQSCSFLRYIFWQVGGWEICTIFELPLDVMLRGHKTSNYKCSLPSRPILCFCTFSLQYLFIRFQLINICFNIFSFDFNLSIFASISFHSISTYQYLLQYPSIRFQLINIRFNIFSCDFNLSIFASISFH